MRFFDTHCDTVASALASRYDFVVPPAPPHIDLPRLLQAGFCAQVFAVFARQEQRPGWDLRAYADEAIDTVHGWAAVSDGAMRIALTAADIRAAAAGQGFYGLLGLEGADPLGESVENLRHFFARGVRLLIPAWGDNLFSGASTGKGGGLTAEGVRLIELTESLRVMVDVSHLSDVAFAEVAAITRHPFIASHSACRALAHAPRNLTDEQIRMLGERGGVVGIPVSPYFLDTDFFTALTALEHKLSFEALAGSGDAAVARRRAEQLGRTLGAAITCPGIDRFVEHVRHAMNVGGEDAVGIGGDLDGVMFLLEGMTGVESYPLLAEAMKKGGLSERQVEKVCWENMARAFGDVLPEKR